jgi:Ca-activated chloride channel family protein
MSPSSIAASFDAAPANFRFAAAVAGFAEILRQSPHARNSSLSEIERIARASAADRGDQQELLDIVKRASAIAGGKPVGGGSVAQ